MIEKYIQQFAEILHKETKLPVEDILALIEIPPENIPGDLAFPCFQLAKQAKSNPNAIAQQLAEKFSNPSFETFAAVGGYLNAHIKKGDFIANFFTNVQHET
jgi:arginyl-tRNA synthetase